MVARILISFLGVMAYTYLLVYKNIVQKFFDENVNKATRITSHFRNVLKTKYLLVKSSELEHNLKALSNIVNIKFDL